MDILVMPMQRLTRYTLLLQAVYKNTENEGQRAELIHMVLKLNFYTLLEFATKARKTCTFPRIVSKFA